MIFCDHLDLCQEVSHTCKNVTIPLTTPTGCGVQPALNGLTHPLTLHAIASIGGMLPKKSEALPATSATPSSCSRFTSRAHNLLRIYGSASLPLLTRCWCSSNCLRATMSMTPYLWNSVGQAILLSSRPSRLPTLLPRPTPEALSMVRAAVVLVPNFRLRLPLPAVV